MKKLNTKDFKNKMGRNKKKSSSFHGSVFGYPHSIIPFLEKKAGFEQSRDIAVIYSGYGELSKLFLEGGNIVFCVEPDTVKRDIAEKKLKLYYNFISIDGTYEECSLSDESVDIIVSPGLYSCLEIEKIKNEFRRILKKGGYLVLVRNDLKKTGYDLIAGYNQLLKKYKLKLTDSARVSDFKKIESVFFGSKKFQKAKFDNPCCYNFNSMKDTLLNMTDLKSPKKTDNLISGELKKLFNTYKKENKVILIYETIIICGKIH